MVQLDTAVVAIIVTILLSIIGLAAAWGSLGQKVKRHDCDLQCQRRENREDHTRIFDKLEEINNYMRNSRPKVDKVR